MPCRRLPLSSTSVWLGDRPRSLADNVMFAMSPPKACALKDGTRKRQRLHQVWVTRILKRADIEHLDWRRAVHGGQAGEARAW